MKVLLSIWTEGRLITACTVDTQYEVTVLDADLMAYQKGYARKFEEPDAATDYATSIAHYFESIAAENSPLNVS
jgi:hypothetical protein